MRSTVKRVFFEDYVFNIHENVYEPAEESFFFAENLRASCGDSVLDVGTGCGILGIVAAEQASEVVAVDLNPYAVQCAKKNVSLNKVRGKFLIIRGDLMGPIEREASFDLILFNAPYLPSDDVEGYSWLERAWMGGDGGRKIIDRFISCAPLLLNADGTILLMQSTLSDVNETILRFGRESLRSEIVARLDLPFFEKAVLIQAMH